MLLPATESGYFLEVLLDSGIIGRNPIQNVAGVLSCKLPRIAEVVSVQIDFIIFRKPLPVARWFECREAVLGVVVDVRDLIHLHLKELARLPIELEDLSVNAMLWSFIHHLPKSVRVPCFDPGLRALNATIRSNTRRALVSQDPKFIAHFLWLLDSLVPLFH